MDYDDEFDVDGALAQEEYAFDGGDDEAIPDLFGAQAADDRAVEEILGLAEIWRGAGRSLVGLGIIDDALDLA